jgi:regulatory protein
MDRTITALSAQKRNPSRVSVYLDGEYAFGLARIVAAWLQVGQALSESKIAELKAQDGREVAYQNAIHYLSFRERSQAEIVTHLKQRQIPEEIISEVIERLQRSGLLNDQRFASLWVENRLEFRPRGRSALAYELRQKGIQQETIQEALDAYDEEPAALQAARKYAMRLKKLEWQVFRQKLSAHLARRGFSYEAARTAVSQVWAEQQGETSDLDTPNDEEVDL